LVKVCSETKYSDEGQIIGPYLVKVCSETKSSGKGHHFFATFGQCLLRDKSSDEGHHFLPHLAEVCCMPHPLTRGEFSFYAKLGQHQLLNMQHLSLIFHFLSAYSMSITADTAYTASFPKRLDIMGAPNQIFKFGNFLDHLIGGIKANTIAAIGTINPGSLCTQYLYAP
jgi:hypothetical protein